ncbi:MAG: sel1 repeat family protein [Sphingomonadales bacterium]|nr:sel1 repeat family protein [Sphingomonadales bacterium]
MNDRRDPNTGELKRLLERLQELTPAPDGALPQRRFGEEAGQHGYQDDGYPDRRLLPPPAPRPLERGATINPWLFVLATALNTTVAAVLAVLITLGVVQQQPDQATTDDAGRRLARDRGGPRYDQRQENVATSAVIAPRKDQAPISNVPVDIRAIGSPDDPLRLEPQRPTRFPLQIEPEQARRSNYILILSGLPSGSGLTGAERISSDSWLLTADAPARLEITIPEWSASLIEVGVELRRTNGTFAAGTTAWLLVAPPVAPKQAQKSDPMAMKELLDKGNQHLSKGDVVAARAVYERAVDLGSAAAALNLGSTYDPNRLWSLGVFGMVGNKERARLWYRRADQLGHPEAKERIRLLGE